MVVGLTGGIGSGKSTVLNIFSRLGDVAIYNADLEAKKLMNNSEKIQKKIAKTFGTEAYLKGVLNTSYLAALVFKDKEKLNKLNAIVHPEVHLHFQQFIEQNEHKTYTIYENAILFENSSDLLCNFILVVSVAKEDRISRVMARDAVSRAAVLARMENQWSDTKKVLQANYLIENYELEKTESQIIKIHNILTKKSTFS